MKMITYLIIGLLALVSSSLWFFLKSSDWVSTNGVIEKIELIEKYNRPDLAMSDNKKSFEYIIDLKYNYTYKSKNYIGTTLFAGLPNIFSHKKDAENILQKYQVGSEVTVYFDPSSPNNSSLHTSASIPIKSIIILVSFVLFVSLIVIGGIIIFPKL